MHNNAQSPEFRILAEIIQGKGHTSTKFSTKIYTKIILYKTDYIVFGEKVPSTIKEKHNYDSCLKFSPLLLASGSPSCAG